MTTRVVRALAGGLLAGAVLGLPIYLFSQVVTAQNVPMGGLTLPNPCTYQPLLFSGELATRSRVTPDATGAQVDLHVNAQEVAAKGQTTGVVYGTQDVFDANPHVGTLPTLTAVTVDVHFKGINELDRFTAHVTLDLDVAADGHVNVRLGPVRLTCG